MNITVKLFAGARSQFGRDNVDVELPAGATVGDLRAALADDNPQLAALLSSSMIAIDLDYADSDRQVPTDAEIAVIPPVSGG